MTNTFLVKPTKIGTVLKETHSNGDASYYLVGPYYVYCNYYDDPYIRPHKFWFDENITVASDEEREKFIKDLADNNLVLDEHYILSQKFKDFEVVVRVNATNKMTKEEILEKLNHVSSPDFEYIKFIYIR